MLRSGNPESEVFQSLEMTESTWQRWNKQLSGMKSSEAKRVGQKNRTNTSADDFQSRVSHWVSTWIRDPNGLNRWWRRIGGIPVALRSSKPAGQSVAGVGTKKKISQARPFAGMFEANHPCGLLFQAQHSCLMADSLARSAHCLNSGDLSRCDKLTSKQSQKSQLTFSVIHTSLLTRLSEKTSQFPPRVSV